MNKKFSAVKKHDKWQRKFILRLFCSLENVIFVLCVATQRLIGRIPGEHEENRLVSVLALILRNRNKTDEILTN